MGELQEVFKLSREEELIYETILSLYKAGWKQYIDCERLAIDFVKNHKSFVFRVDYHGELYLYSYESVVLEDLEDVQEIFGKLIKEVNLFLYFKWYVDYFERFLLFEELFTLADKDFTK